MSQRQVPEYATVTTSLTCKNASKSIGMYKEVFGADEIMRLNMPGTDRIMHAVIQIGDTKIMLADEWPGCPSAGAALYIYVPDCDETYQKAKDAGMSETMPPDDMFWGDRLAAVVDENGVRWSLATHKRDVPKDELEKAAEEFAKKMQAQAAA